MPRPAYNPLSQWMHFSDVYVTFDRMDILKKSSGAEDELIGHVENGNLSWPLFMQLITGFMQYSVVETGFTKALDKPEHLKALSEWLTSQDENSFVLRLKNCKVQRKGMEAAQEAAEQMTRLWGQWLDMNPFFRQFNPARKWEEAFDIFKNPEIDLGTLAGQCAGWLEMAQAMQPRTGRG